MRRRGMPYDRQLMSRLTVWCAVCLGRHVGLFVDEAQLFRRHGQILRVLARRRGCQPCRRPPLPPTAEEAAGQK